MSQKKTFLAKQPQKSNLDRKAFGENFIMLSERDKWAKVHLIS